MALVQEKKPVEPLIESFLAIKYFQESNFRAEKQEKNGFFFN